VKQDVELYSADWTLHFRPPSLEVLEMHHRNFYVYRGIGVRRNGRQRRKASEQRPENAIVEKIGVGLCSIFDAMRQGAFQQLPTKGDTLFVNSGNQLHLTYGTASFDYLDTPCAWNHVCTRSLAASNSVLVIFCRRAAKRSSSPPS
jgi:hypothetical protein